MGWTSFNLNKPVKEWFIDNWSSTGKHEVLDVAIVKYRTLYAAIKHKETNEVFAVVYLLSYSPKSYYNFAYKDMDETCGPYKFECPERIMKVLTPTTHQYALEWRERVRMYHKTRKSLKGAIISFKEAFTFSNGATYKSFMKVGNKTYAGIFQNGKLECKTRVSIDLLYYMIKGEYEMTPI